jgi:hypothetical protein
MAYRPFGLRKSTEASGKNASTWAVMARGEDGLAAWRKRPDWRPPQRQDHVALWTDDFSNLLTIFIWR